MNETIELVAAEDHRFSAYVARPTAAPRGAVVVLQEIFGVNAHIRGIADGFAHDGYLAIAPALFDRVERNVQLGYAAPDVQRGRQLKDAADAALAMLDISAAVEHVRSTGRVGAVGYCWGGLLAWLAAAEVEGLSAVATYYGGGMPNHADAQPRCPVLSHFGERDTAIPLDGVEAFRASHPEVELHLYPAGHGFNCDQRASFDAASATLARQRTLAFFARHVG